MAALTLQPGERLCSGNLGSWPAGEGRLCHKVHPTQQGMTRKGRCCGCILQSSSEFGFCLVRGVLVRVSTSMAALPIGCAPALVLEKSPVSPVTCRLSQIALLWVELCAMLWGSFFLSLLTGITVMCVTVW